MNRKAGLAVVVLALTAGTRCTSSPADPGGNGSGGSMSGGEAGQAEAVGGAGRGSAVGGSAGAATAGSPTTSGGSAEGVAGASPVGGSNAGGSSMAGSSAKANDAWPQAGGPEGTFRLNVDGAPTNDVADDAQRSHTDGWAAPAFYPAPIVLGNKIYFGTTLGITYVIDTTAKVLDETAILGYGDLGPLGQTWTLAAPGFAGGVLYHHSSKQVVAIGAGP